MQRDLFGRMLGVSMKEKIDVAKILSYPPTPVPMSLCHLDGTMYKTNKSTLMKVLEKKITSHPPGNIDVVVLDGFFMLHLIKEVPKTFGSISKKILQMVTKFSASRIDLVFDQYFSPSIKDNERARRDGFEDRAYVITGPDQVRPSDFGKELQKSNFKIALVRFLIAHWGSDEVAPFLGNKTVYLDFDKCYCYKVVNETVEKSIDEQLSCDHHEEADTKIIYHVCNINFDANVVIKCSDTDILIIMLGNMDHLSHPLNIWMDTGVANNRRYIDVTSLYNNLGETISKALPGFHAVTGCDYNPAFFKKGKNRPFTLLGKNTNYQEAFSKLADYNLSRSEKDELFLVLENFICRMYNVKEANTVNEARFEIFTLTFKSKNVNEPFNRKFRNVDASNLPPCRSELHQQLLRSHYICSLWRNAHLKNPTQLLPNESGWIECDGKYELLWFEGEQSPPLVNDVIVQPGSLDENINLSEDENDQANDDDNLSEDDDED